MNQSIEPPRGPYPPQLPPNHTTVVNGQQPNPGLTFLGMSGGILALVLTLTILGFLALCVGIPLLCFGGVIFDSVINPTPTP